MYCKATVTETLILIRLSNILQLIEDQLPRDSAKDPTKTQFPASCKDDNPYGIFKQLHTYVYPIRIYENPENTNTHTYVRK